MVGTLINVAAILIGGSLGMLLGNRLNERLKSTVIAGLGLFTLVYGVSLFFKTGNSLIVLGSLLIGILLGEWWRIEEGLSNLGSWLESKFNRSTSQGNKANFINGFFTTSLLFCIGPMAILGSIQNGVSGNYETLAIKSVLDGFAAFAFGSSLGFGVLFSAVPVLIYQGAITLLAVQVKTIATDTMMNELTAVGGVILVGIAISNLLEIKKIRTGNFLPALLMAPLIVWILNLFK
jgi:uncharacterized membrane protein YqgA involved in biofilm formation